VNPGARLPSRRWFAERFAAVADALADDGYRIVLTGSRDERDLTSAVQQRMRSPAADLAGRTTLGALAVLLKRARLLVSNDTGVSHIATAVGTPSVVVTLGSDPARWAPLDGERHAAVHRPVECRPCGFDECPVGHACATALTPALVLEAARKQLKRSTACVPCGS
jgi:ADP-heptose:LPS heptosyltransferase